MWRATFCWLYFMHRNLCDCTERCLCGGESSGHTVPNAVQPSIECCFEPLAFFLIGICRLVATHTATPKLERQRRERTDCFGRDDPRRFADAVQGRVMLDFRAPIPSATTDAACMQACLDDEGCAAYAFSDAGRRTRCEHSGHCASRPASPP